MLSALSQVRVVTEAFMADARDFIVKPFQSETLVNATNDSFKPKNRLSQEILKQIYAGSMDNTYNLSQNEINAIIITARYEMSGDDVSAILANLNERNPDPIHACLDRLEHGVEELGRVPTTPTAYLFGRFYAISRQRLLAYFCQYMSSALP